MVEFEEVDENKSHGEEEETGKDEGENRQVKNQKSKSGNTKISKEQYYVKYTDIHNPDKEQEEGAGGIGDLYQLMAIAVGGVCYFYRFKWAAWLCLYFFYCSVINMNHASMLQQGSTSLGLVSIAFIQVYVAPDPAELERKRRAQEILKNPEKQILEK